MGYRRIDHVKEEMGKENLITLKVETEKTESDKHPYLYWWRNHL